MKRAIFIGLLLIVLFTIGCSSKASYDECLSDDPIEERNCFTAIAYHNVDPKVCEAMPEEENAQQANKGFCLGFVASVTGDIRICRNQANSYYANVCEIVYDRFFMGYDPMFEELKREYSKN